MTRGVSSYHRQTACGTRDPAPIVRPFLSQPDAVQLKGERPFVRSGGNDHSQQIVRIRPELAPRTAISRHVPSTLNDLVVGVSPVFWT